jgi:hypothetical protein
MIPKEEVPLKRGFSDWRLAICETLRAGRFNCSIFATQLLTAKVPAMHSVRQTSTAPQSYLVCVHLVRA